MGDISEKYSLPVLNSGNNGGTETSPRPVLEGPVEEADLVDSYGRTHDYLRISVTDRCNMQCVYCMPPEGIQKYDREAILRYEELLQVARIGVAMGIRKIRITGGDPGVRKGLVSFVEKLSELEDLKTLALTTNGLFLPKKLDALKQTRLRHINISLDSLDEDRFERITRGADLGRVLEALYQTVEKGFHVKINVVALPDLSLEDVEAFSGLAEDLDVEVRFIEFMPLCGSAWSYEEFTPLTDLRNRVVSQLNLQPVGREGVSNTYELPGSDRGRIGFIASLSSGFCGTCSRLRLSSEGVLYSCLFTGDGVPLRATLRNGGSDRAVARRFLQSLQNKWEGNPAYTGDWDPESEEPPHQFSLIRSIGG